MTIENTLETVGMVLLRSYAMVTILLMIWFLLFVGAGDWICSFHGRIFDLTFHECALMHYGGLAIMKIFALVILFFPWIAVRLVLRVQRRRSAL